MLLFQAEDEGFELFELLVGVEGLLFELQFARDRSAGEVFPVALQGKSGGAVPAVGFLAGAIALSLHFVASGFELVEGGL